MNQGTIKWTVRNLVVYLYNNFEFVILLKKKIISFISILLIKLLSTLLYSTVDHKTVLINEYENQKLNHVQRTHKLISLGDRKPLKLKINFKICKNSTSRALH